MKKLMMAVALVLMSLIAAPAKAQTPVQKVVSYASQTTVTLDAQVGGGSIGYNPEVNVGGSLTFPVTRRIEFYTQALYSPLTKTGYSGHTLTGDARTIFWLDDKAAIFIGVRPSYVDFGGTQKHAFNGLVGLVVRDHFSPTMPGRLVLAYEQEIGGCVWATSTNPCPITSAEFIGGRLEQDFRETSHFRVGLAAAVGRINQQINPNAPAAGPIYGIAAQFELTARFTFRHESTDAY